MGRFPQETWHQDPAPPPSIGSSGSGGDAADAAFEALRAAACSPADGTPPLSDADFERLLVQLKGLEGRAPHAAGREAQRATPRPSLCLHTGQRAHEQSQNDRREPRMEDARTTIGLHRSERTVIVQVAEGLERLYGKLAQAKGDLVSLPPGMLDELARLSISLRIVSLKGEPDAVLMATAGGWRFALPLAVVEELWLAQERPAGLAVLDPRTWWDGGEQDAATAARYWVVVATNTRRVALAVTALHGVCIAPVSPPGPVLAATRAIAGIVRDGHGVPAVLVRLEEVLSSEEFPATGVRAPTADY